MRRIRLLAASLHYPPQFIVHTASSGPITSLDELYFLVERDGGLLGFGAIRENVAYLTGLEAAGVRSAVAALARALDWSRPRDEIAERFDRVATGAPAIARALIDTTLVDWAARERGIPVAELFGAAFKTQHTTNQSLFVSDNCRMLAMAEGYVARGFVKLKLRVGARSAKHDCERLALLRDRFGRSIELAIDANGAWSLEEAIANLRAMAGFDLAYAEQPIAAGNWQTIDALAAATSVPIMLDESLAASGDIQRIIDAGGKLWAHLKIIKLGGISPTIACARKLAAAGIPFMIGQMNEGAGATASAYHCATAVEPDHAELYGADGLVDDPVRGVSYAHGAIRMQRAPGLGVSIDTQALATLWEIRA
jgi:L-alanine-DL-glutamate epimerase-like enolase superfamily enzyme